MCANHLGAAGKMEPARIGRRGGDILRLEALRDREQGCWLVGCRLQTAAKFARNPVVGDETRLRICVTQRGDQRRAAVRLVVPDDRGERPRIIDLPRTEVERYDSCGDILTRPVKWHLPDRLAVDHTTSLELGQSLW